LQWDTDTVYMAKTSLENLISSSESGKKLSSFMGVFGTVILPQNVACLDYRNLDLNFGCQS